MWSHMELSGHYGIIWSHMVTYGHLPERPLRGRAAALSLFEEVGEESGEVGRELRGRRQRHAQGRQHLTGALQGGKSIACFIETENGPKTGFKPGFFRAFKETFQVTF